MNIQYSSTARQMVKPTIIEMHIDISKKAPTTEEAVAKLVDTKTLLVESVMKSLESYKEGTYRQTNIRIRKNYRQEEQKIKEGKEVKTIRKQVFDSYSASVSIGFTMENRECTVAEFATVLDICAKKECYCTYDFTIAPEEQEEYSRVLQARAIDEGYDHVAGMLGKSQYLGKRKPVLVDISYRFSSGSSFNYESERSGIKTKGIATVFDRVEEEIITEEVVKDLFETASIELSESYALTFALE